MIGFGIDEIQAEYVAEIKLRHLNREYILKRTDEIESLEKDIAELKAILESKTKVKNIIIKELATIAEKYGQPRKSMIIYASDIVETEIEEEIPDYPVNLFFTKEGYFKKITPLSLRMGGEQKLKDGDVIQQSQESMNNTDLLFFSDKSQVYKTKARDFSDTKASVLGEFIPAKLNMDEGESAIYMLATTDYSGYVFFFFENGKVAKVSLKAYETKTNRKKLTGAYSDKEKLSAIVFVNDEDSEILMRSSSGRALLLHTGAIASKTTRNTQGVAVFKQRKGHRLISAELYHEGMLQTPQRYRTKSIPSSGALPTAEELEGEQLELK